MIEAQRSYAAYTGSQVGKLELKQRQTGFRIFAPYQYAIFISVYSSVTDVEP